jgi:RNA polymerase sigma factor (sigma-70 family)
MSSSTLGLFLRHLALSDEVSRLGSASDRQLLTSYETERGEAAFTELVRRHGPMVLRTCRRVLGQGPDADDAFQATFVLLARKAGRLSREEAGPLSLGGWLHRVAYQTSQNVLSQGSRRKTREQRATAMPPAERSPVTEASWNELRPILDAELNALPDDARRLLVACYLQEKTHSEAAVELGLPLGSLARRLDTARELLASRLARKGITVSSALLAALLGESASAADVPAVLMVHTVEAAVTFAGRAGASVGDPVARLVNAGLANMAKGRTYLSLGLAGLVGLLGVGLLACQTFQAPPDQDATPAQVKSVLADQYGDPLPPGALARLGTQRMRTAETGARSVLFTPDGRAVLTAGRDNPARLWDLTTGKLLRQFGDGVRRHVTAAALSPDGRVLAGRGGSDGGLRLWEFASGKLLAEGKGGPADLVCVAFAPDGKAVASVGNDGKLRLWDARLGHERWVQHCPAGHVAAVVFSEDGKTLAAVETKGLSLWDTATGQKSARRWDSDRPFAAAVFSPDGGTLAVACVPPTHAKDPIVRLVDVATLKEVRQLSLEKLGPTNVDPIQALALSRGGRILATASGSGEVSLWDTETGKELRRCQGDRSFSTALAFSADGELFVGADRGILRLWETATAKERLPVRGGNRQIVSAVAFAPDGQTVISSGWDGSVREWDPATGSERRQLVPPGEHAGDRQHVGFAAAVSADGKSVAAVHLVWALRPGEPFGLLARTWDRGTVKERTRNSRDLAEGLPSPMALSPDGKTVAFVRAAGGSEEVNLWELATGKVLFRFRGGQPAFSPDGRLVVTTLRGPNEWMFSLWDASTGKQHCTVPMPKGHSYRMAFSPEGKSLATVSNPGAKHTIHLWQIQEESSKSGQALRVGPPRLLTEAQAMVRDLAFSPDGHSLAVPEAGGTLRIVETATGSERLRLTGHAGEIWSLAFSPEGRRLASGGADTTILIWDLTGRLEGGRLRPGQLFGQKMTEIWADLAADDARRAGRALWALAADPARSLPFLKEHLRPAVPLSPAAAAKLLSDLDDKSYAVRTQARRELEKLDAVAEPAMRQARAKTISAEVRRALDEMLTAVEAHRQRPAGEVLRGLRAVEVLEQIGTTGARQLLRAWADGAPGAALTQQARVALDRAGRSARP